MDIISVFSDKERRRIGGDDCSLFQYPRDGVLTGVTCFCMNYIKHFVKWKAPCLVLLLAGYVFCYSVKEDPPVSVVMTPSSMLPRVTASRSFLAAGVCHRCCLLVSLFAKPIVCAGIHVGWTIFCSASWTRLNSRLIAAISSLFFSVVLFLQSSSSC